MTTTQTSTDAQCPRLALPLSNAQLTLLWHQRRRRRRRRRRRPGALLRRRRRRHPREEEEEAQERSWFIGGRISFVRRRDSRGPRFEIKLL
jgi:hypothetical protein